MCHFKPNTTLPVANYFAMTATLSNLIKEKKTNSKSFTTDLIFSTGSLII